MLHIQTIPRGETPKYTLCVVDLHVFSIVIDFFYYYACVCAQLLNYRSVPGKCSWTLKHKSRFWFAWALTHNITCIEAYPKVGACPGPYSIIVMYIHCTCTREQWHIILCTLIMKFTSIRRIAYQESSHSFAVVSCRIDVASTDDPKTFKPLRQR